MVLSDADTLHLCTGMPTEVKRSRATQILLSTSWTMATAMPALKVAWCCFTVSRLTA